MGSQRRRERSPSSSVESGFSLSPERRGGMTDGQDSNPIVLRNEDDDTSHSAVDLQMLSGTGAFHHHQQYNHQMHDLGLHMTNRTMDVHLQSHHEQPANYLHTDQILRTIDGRVPDLNSMEMPTQQHNMMRMPDIGGCQTNPFPKPPNIHIINRSQSNPQNPENNMFPTRQEATQTLPNPNLEEACNELQRNKKSRCQSGSVQRAVSNSSAQKEHQLDREIKDGKYAPSAQDVNKQSRAVDYQEQRMISISTEKNTMVKDGDYGPSVTSQQHFAGSKRTRRHSPNNNTMDKTVSNNSISVDSIPPPPSPQPPKKSNERHYPLKDDEADSTGVSNVEDKDVECSGKKKSAGASPTNSVNEIAMASSDAAVTKSENTLDLCANPISNEYSDVNEAQTTGLSSSAVTENEASSLLRCDVKESAEECPSPKIECTSRIDDRKSPQPANFEVGEDTYVVSDIPPPDESQSKLGHDSTCSFTASNPYLLDSKAVLGSDFADIFFEHGTNLQDDAPGESSDCLSVSCDGSAEITELPISVKSGRKDLVHLRRLSSCRAVDTSHENDAQDDECRGKNETQPQSSDDEVQTKPQSNNYASTCSFIASNCAVNTSHQDDAHDDECPGKNETPSQSNDVEAPIRSDSNNAEVQTQPQSNDTQFQTEQSHIPTCSFTASNPLDSKAGLGSDFAESYSERKLETDLQENVSRDGPTEITEPPISVNSGRKDLAHHSRLSSGSAVDTSRQNDAQVDECLGKNEIQPRCNDVDVPIQPDTKDTKVQTKAQSIDTEAKANLQMNETEMQTNQDVQTDVLKCSTRTEDSSRIHLDLRVTEPPLQPEINSQTLASQTAIVDFPTKKPIAKKKTRKRITPPLKSKKKKGNPKQDIPSPASLCKAMPKPETNMPIEYPHAPMGSIWLNQSLVSSKETMNLSSGGTLMGRHWVWDEGYFVDAQFNTSSNPKKISRPLCTCESNHVGARQLQRKNSISATDANCSRRSGRSGTSSRMNSVLNELASGTLSPHTLISCEEYANGPEHRFSDSLPIEDVQPFSVRVSPDATFLADLHAHMCQSEIIGFLGGHYSAEEKCLYIQAAFPCKSTDRDDSGQTDVEMDPVSQIYAREAIDIHGMSVVGWYHSHPTFQPDPSVTDIENQANYQQLFAESLHVTGSVIPFVGLIVGTYDSQNPTSQSVMRWFHVRSQCTATYKTVQFPMNLKVTERQYRKIADNTSSSTSNRLQMTGRGVEIRRTLETDYLLCPLTNSPTPGKLCDLNTNAAMSAKPAGTTEADTETATNAPPNSKEESPAADSRKTDKGDEIEKSSSLLLSEEMLNQDCKAKANAFKFTKARPLYFSDLEESILDMPIESDVHDVVGGIIWYAVEREQRMSKSSFNATSPIPTIEPPSSGAIFELILRKSFTSFDEFEQKLYHIIRDVAKDCVKKPSIAVRFNGSDAVMTHNVDAIISHYSTNPKKVSPFSSWSGALDKGNISKGSNSISSDGQAQVWRDYYLTKVLEMRRIEADDVVKYEGGAKKMKRGHKMAACLLKWAAAMQLNSHYKSSYHQNHEEASLIFEHETQLNQHLMMSASHNGHYYFVAEVMRLVAAKWRENSGKCNVSTPPKKRAKRSSSRAPGSETGDSSAPPGPKSFKKNGNNFTRTKRNNN